MKLVLFESKEYPIKKRKVMETKKSVLNYQIIQAQIQQF